MNSEIKYYRRNLPHFQSADAIYSIVFRLSGSLPVEVVVRLQEEYRKKEQSAKNSSGDGTSSSSMVSLYEEHFRVFDSHLDGSSSGPHWLRTDGIAQITADALQYANGDQYLLIAYCIMPNHVHIILALTGNNGSTISAMGIPYPLTRILHSLKRHTARESNKLLHREGAFWQHESYDHIIRDGKELQRTVEYVIGNPVSAGLVKNWEDWKWTYVNKDWLEKNL
ncbi:MAG: transposase [Ignavibacteriales bacterium]|nr:transposase [Ignavibacteriales bacterium]